MKPFLLATAVVTLLTASVHAASPVMLDPDTTQPLAAIPADFMGVSMEMKAMLPDDTGKYLFRADNKPLIAMFKFLGIKNLRMGGNTADNPSIKVPEGADIDNLFAFTRAAEVKVIYTLRLRGITDPKQDAGTAKYVMDHYKADIVGLQIGNEPNVYAKTYPEYRDLLNKFIAAITSPDVAPDAVFCGPNATPGKTAWAKQAAIEFAKSSKLKMITQHAYPGGNRRNATDVAAARDKMLSTDWVAGYEKFHKAFAVTATENGFPYRIEEANSFFNGGLKDASNSHAAALWGLDYLYWWAAHGAAGINFHTGDKVAAADESAPCWYALFWTSPQGYKANPLGYAVKAFDLGSHGTLRPLKITSSDKVNMTAYFVGADDGTFYLTIINKEHGANGRDATVTLPAGSIGAAQAMFLTAPNNDIASITGETLGGATIGEDASWTGTWTPLAASNGNNRWTVEVPRATAAVVKLTHQ